MSQLLSSSNVLIKERHLQTLREEREGRETTPAMCQVGSISRRRKQPESATCKKPHLNQTEGNSSLKKKKKNWRLINTVNQKSFTIPIHLLSAYQFVLRVYFHKCKFTIQPIHPTGQAAPAAVSLPGSRQGQEHSALERNRNFLMRKLIHHSTGKQEVNP